MKITFTLTRQDFWRYHPDADLRNPLPTLIRLLWLPLLSFGVCSVSGLALATSLVICVAVWLFPLIFWALGIVPVLRDVKQREANGERVAEIGKFDFRYGMPATDGYYHHWSYCSEITETAADIVLVFSGKRRILIPKSAFQMEDEARRFLAKARLGRETAIRKQWEQGTGAVWPPAPHPGA